VDGIAYEVDCQMIVFKEGNVDIGMCDIFRHAIGTELN